MRRATDKTYPQKISQIAMYAAARKFKFFMAFLLQACSLHAAFGSTGFSLWILTAATASVIQSKPTG
jgi:hypothetical protein